MANNTIITELSPDVLKGLHSLIGQLLRQQETSSDNKRDENKEDDLKEDQLEETVPVEKKKRGRPPKKLRGEKKGHVGGPLLTDDEVFSVQLTSGKVNVRGQPNKFERMPEFNGSKADTKIDKKLWGNNKPSRRPDPYKPIEAECTICRKLVKIHPMLAYKDPDTKELVTTCNKCVKRRS